MRWSLGGLVVATLCWSGCGASGVGDDAGASPVDAGTAGPGDAGAPPRCVVSADAVSCSANLTTLTAGTASRDVYWQTPLAAPPPGGYPVVVLFQGSFFGPQTTWGTVALDTPFGGYQQARLQAVLLEHGFTVVAPSAAVGLAWQTNTGLPWEVTSDQPFIDALLDAIARGEFGPADPTRWYATGISSGGYMTSRMALSYPGRFRALAIHSGSWATCAGVACVVPLTMPAGHPPTLFLHGQRDLTVPLLTARPYVERLSEQGFTSELVVDEDAQHEWLPVAPERITAWFEGQ